MSKKCPKNIKSMAYLVLNVEGPNLKKSAEIGLVH